jgi:biotin transporter BioY
MPHWLNLAVGAVGLAVVALVAERYGPRWAADVAAWYVLCALIGLPIQRSNKGRGKGMHDLAGATR